jgi:S-DNA-T family DNA segregation ATPase FtsK/SpoIIIE
MASRAFTPARNTAGSGSGGRKGQSDWRAILRRSFRRSAELIGGTLLFGALVFMVLALVSYTQTDPSGSTASGSPVENWMGLAGAWGAERLLMLFGLPGGLMLPLLFVFARRLWDGTGDLIEETDDDADVPALVAGWRLMLMMLAYSAIYIPYSALLGVLTPNSQDRCSASSYRFVMALLPVFVIVNTATPLARWFGGSENAPAGWRARQPCTGARILPPARKAGSRWGWPW